MSLALSGPHIPCFLPWQQARILVHVTQCRTDIASRIADKRYFYIPKGSNDLKVYDWMSLQDQSRILSWLSEVVTPGVSLGDNGNHPATRFIFDGIPSSKQTVDAGYALERRKADIQQQALLEPERVVKLHPHPRPMTKRTDSRQSRTEKNGYERMPRSKTKADRYEYKGKSTRKKDELETTPGKKKFNQRRRHTINEDFHASNVPANRLTLHSALNLGIFNKGKRSSPVKARVPENGFSEIDFLNKSSAIEQGNQSLRQANRLSMLNYNKAAENSPHKSHEPRVESSIRESPRRRFHDVDIGTNQGNTALYHGSEACNGETTNTNFAPFSKPGNQHLDQKSREVPPGKTTLTDSVKESSMVQMLENYLCIPGARAAADTNKRYWTLEDLKCLMEQRAALWTAETEDSTSSCEVELEPSKKRDHEHLEAAEDLPVEGPTKRRRIRESAFELIGTPTVEGIMSLQERDSKRDHIDYAEGTVIQPQRPFQDTRLNSIHSIDLSLFPEAFDAEYEAIMRSAPDATDTLPDFLPIGDDTAGYHACGYTPALQTLYNWGLGFEERGTNEVALACTYLTAGTGSEGELPETPYLRRTLTPHFHLPVKEFPLRDIQYSVSQPDPELKMESAKAEMPSTERKRATGAAGVVPLTKVNLNVHDMYEQPEQTHEIIRAWVEAVKPRHFSSSDRPTADLSWLEWKPSPLDEETSSSRPKVAGTNPFRYQATSIVHPHEPIPEEIRQPTELASGAESLKLEQEKHGSHKASNSRSARIKDLAPHGQLTFSGSEPRADGLI
ncbi:hypothetical protein BJX64DRAFT_287800 [Aspergillus heterothallicus]